VQHELNTAFVRSIEDRDVRVIPAIGQGVDFSDLPIDLRGRYALDLRTSSALSRGILELTELAKPEKRIRRELLQRLRTPARSGATFDELANHALRGADQAVQVAALRGATKLHEFALGRDLRRTVA
jgi:hypothetical protein